MCIIYGVRLQELMREPLGGLTDILPGERRERLERIRHEKDRYRCLGAGLLTAYGLCRAGVTLPQQKFCRGDSGKPSLKEDHGIYFNVSHAGDYVLAAVADREIGIDIECRRKIHASSVRKCCSAKEREWLGTQADPDMAFLRMWTVKESYLKWTGEGLRVPLADLETHLPEAAPGEISRDGIREPVTLWEYCGLPDSRLCVCAGGQYAAWEICWLSVADLVELLINGKGA